jgi:quercetin dioxygenase-like cupin family protein
MKEVSRRLATTVQENAKNVSANELQELVANHASSQLFLERLERSDGGKPLCRATVKLLADAYGVPPLLLDPLFSETLRNAISLVESIQRFEPVNEKSRYYGYGTEYSIPQTKLDTGTDVSFGHLKIAGESHSDFHDHPGTELLLLLDGTEIELRLETSGVRIPIRKGEFVFFRSEMPHSAWNVTTDPASVFVIRFYQLRSESTREKVLQITNAAIDNLKEYQQDVNKLKKKITKPKGKSPESSKQTPLERLSTLEKMITNLPQAHKFGDRLLYIDLPNIVKSLTKRVSSKILDELEHSPPTDVEDLFGLALLLDKLKGPRNLRAIASLGGFGAAELSHIHNAQRQLVVEDLQILAGQYQIEPMILYSFLFPTEPDIVTGRIDAMAAIPDSLVGGGVRYRCPRCNLALSDIHILVVELDPGQTTKRNWHPGFELAIPLDESTITIEIESEQPKQIAARDRQYAHYSSERPHLLRNVGSTVATAFVVRFFE